MTRIRTWAASRGMRTAGCVRDETGVVDGRDETGLLELARVDLGGWDVLPGRELVEGACSLPGLYWIGERAWHIGLAGDTLFQREGLRAAGGEGCRDHHGHCQDNSLHGAILNGGVARAVAIGTTTAGSATPFAPVRFPSLPTLSRGRACRWPPEVQDCVESAIEVRHAWPSFGSRCRGRIPPALVPFRARMDHMRAPAIRQRAA